MHRNQRLVVAVAVTTTTPLAVVDVSPCDYQFRRARAITIDDLFGIYLGTDNLFQYSSQSHQSPSKKKRKY
jgi:uncharacterized membrane protein YcjF (UPF0283 family)